MSDDERALIAAIQAAPDENTPRLAYADWLDENGTTDQHRARAEWIRMTCDDRSRRTRMPTGQQIRRPRERAWLRENAPRLWPNLMRFKANGGKLQTYLSFSTGEIAFTVPLEIPARHSAPAAQLDQSVVVLTAERGVATRATVSFLRAALVTPAIARDDPAVPIRFAEVPNRCFEIGAGWIGVLKRPFVLRGLTGVWDAIELENGSANSPAKVLKFEGARPPYRGTLEPLINAALTKWARDQAARPDPFGAERVEG